MRSVIRQFKRRVEPRKQLRQASVRLLGVDDRPVAREAVETAVDASYSMVNDAMRRVVFGQASALTPEFVEQKYDRLAGAYIDADYRNSDTRGVYWVDGKLRETHRHTHYRKMMDEYAHHLRRVPFDSCLEVGAGELTTLAEMAGRLGSHRQYHGIDLSFPRLYQGVGYFADEPAQLRAVRADARRLPYPDDSFDLVYTAHCLEHMPFDFRRAIDEMLRVARHTVVLFEPSYELAGPLQKLRMRANGYVRGLDDYLGAIDDRGAVVVPARLLDNASPFNRTARYMLHLPSGQRPATRHHTPILACPQCTEPLDDPSWHSSLRCHRCHRAYPVIEGIADLGVDAAYCVESSDDAAASQSDSE